MGFGYNEVELVQPSIAHVPLSKVAPSSKFVAFTSTNSH